jgi:hypothetical protein
MHPEQDQWSGDDDRDLDDRERAEELSTEHPNQWSGDDDRDLDTGPRWAWDYMANEPDERTYEQRRGEKMPLIHTPARLAELREQLQAEIAALNALQLALDTLVGQVDESRGRIAAINEQLGNG